MAKQWDSGTAVIQSNKNAQPQLFNITFSAPPEVIVTAGGNSASRATGATNITTTGFDIECESAELVHWVARETGYEAGGAVVAEVSCSVLEADDPQAVFVSTPISTAFTVLEAGDLSGASFSAVSSICTVFFSGIETGDPQAVFVSTPISTAFTVLEADDPQAVFVSTPISTAFTVLEADDELVGNVDGLATASSVLFEGIDSISAVFSLPANVNATFCELGDFFSGEVLNLATLVAFLTENGDITNAETNLNIIFVGETFQFASPVRVFSAAYSTRVYPMSTNARSFLV